ncbi:MAG: formate dehydrogenase subunit delta [Salinisphaera sp.]|jgi:formate dehydrogenase subunit delta|nr:formate dehydrogenase subunit delta [Salinisphaera sp.]
MDSQKMVHQANQIAAYFEVYPQQRAEEEVETHIRKFWEPRIRTQLINYPGDGLHPLVQKAVAALKNDTGQSA